MIKINMSKDFSNSPFGRYATDGAFSGERFRKEFIVPILEKNHSVEIDLTGIDPVGSSFFDEAFHGLISEDGFSSEYLTEKITFICKDDPFLETHVKSFLLDLY